MIFAVLSVFSFIKGGKIGFMTNFALTFFVVLMGNLDTSLRTYHLEVDKLKWITLLLGLGGLLYLGYKHRKNLLGLVKVSLVYILFLGLVYLPWPIKNYMETGNLSAQTFIKGKEIGVPK